MARGTECAPGNFGNVNHIEHPAHCQIRKVVDCVIRNTYALIASETIDRDESLANVTETGVLKVSIFRDRMRLTGTIKIKS
jgi:hypothetical protein